MQACARQILGEEEVTFPAYYADPECNAACNLYGIIGADGKVKQGHGYMWRHDNWHDVWSIDAFTLDPSRELSSLSVVYSAGLEPPVKEMRTANASPGDVPKVQVFLAAHPKHGIFAIYPNRSCRGGPQGAWDGYETWVDKLRPEEAEFIKANSYYNYPDVLKKLTPEERRSMQEEDFDAENFLVRFCYCRFAHSLAPHPTPTMASQNTTP